MPLVSIIIPTYNHARYVGTAIQSVLEQSYRHVEIIAVDDGSTDETRDVVGAFGGEVHYIWQVNQGLSAARNTGIRVARGEYIGLLDADDLYEPAFVETLVTILETQQDAGAAYSGYRFVDVNDTPLHQVEQRIVPAQDFHTELLNGNFLVPECMLVRASVYAATGPFDESLRACEDWDMWLRIAEHNKIIGTDTILIRHRILPGSMSSDPVRMLENRLAVLTKRTGHTPAASDYMTPAQRHAYGYAYLTTAVEYLQCHMPGKSAAYFRRMCEIAPELLETLSVFYEMGCGDQPKGRRGDFATLDVRRNATVLLDILTDTFDRSYLPAAICSRRRTAFGNAYFALGLLGYGAGDVQAARSFLVRALVTHPQLLQAPQFGMTLAKTIVLSAPLSRFARSLYGAAS